MHTHADLSQRKVSIVLDLEHFVSFVVVGKFDFYFDTKCPSPGTIKKVMGWCPDQNHIRFAFQHGRRSYHGTGQLTGVTHHCVIPRTKNSGYTITFSYPWAMALMQLLAKDRFKYCCRFKINIYSGKMVNFRVVVYFRESSVSWKHQLSNVFATFKTLSFLDHHELCRTIIICHFSASLATSNCVLFLFIICTQYKVK